MLHAVTTTLSLFRRVVSIPSTMPRRTTQSAANQCVRTGMRSVSVSVSVSVSAAGQRAPKLSAEGSTYPSPRNAHHVSPRAYSATSTRSHALQRSLAWHWPVRLSNPVARTSVSGAAASSTSSGVCYSVKLEKCTLLAPHESPSVFFLHSLLRQGKPTTLKMHHNVPYRAVRPSAPSSHQSALLVPVSR